MKFALLLSITTLAAPAYGHGHYGPSYDADLGHWPEEECATATAAPTPTPSDLNVNPYYSSVGSCYIHGSPVTCNIAEADCTGTHYAPGYVSGYGGCCHCEGGCDHSAETAAAGTCEYPDTITSVGSCYISGSGVTCNTAEADCTGSYYAPGYVSGYGGCCHCLGGCDHDAETAEVGTCEYTDVADRRKLAEVQKQHVEEEIEYRTASKARRELMDRRRLGTCSYSDVCCMNPDTNECVLMGNPPVGHSDVVMDHCPTSEEGASGLFSVMIDESGGRFAGCCKEVAASVEWTYTDGSSTGADVEGNTGCQSTNSCVYEETCCYNSFSDHKCYLYKGLPEVEGGYSYGDTNVPKGMVSCPDHGEPGYADGWIYASDEADGRNNGCCEDMMDASPNTFLGAAIDGNHCWLDHEHTTTLADCSVYTGHWIGFKADDTSDDILLYSTLADAEAAGCHLGDWFDEKANLRGNAPCPTDAPTPAETDLDPLTGSGARAGAIALPVAALTMLVAL